MSPTTAPPWHPWREAGRRPHLVIECVPLADNLRGCIRGGIIHLNADDLQAERRCTLSHELVHDERRIFPLDRTLRKREERTVESIAARRLISLDRLVDALRWSRNISEIADELWVDVPMLTALFRSLERDERKWIDDELRRREPG